MDPHPTVLVTGSTGHLGSWLVMRLLEKGYCVRATVLDPEDKKDLYPLSVISPSLANRLEIVKANLLVNGDFDTPAQGCKGVFHLACPTNFSADDPQKQAIEPSVLGTLNVLSACIKSTPIKRVIHVSSAAAIRTPGKEDPEQAFDESYWTDVDFCLEKKITGWPYFVAKTLGERAAVEFAQRHNLDVVVVNPTLVTGPFLLPRIPNSIKDALALVTGDISKYQFLKCMSYVHTDDVVHAFIFLYETQEASGRYICSAADACISDVVNIIQADHPEFPIPTELSYLGEPAIHYFNSSKLKALGFQYKHTLKDMLGDAIKCCKEKGLL